MCVTTVEQTLVDFVLRPDLGEMPADAQAAALALVPRADQERRARAMAGLRPAPRARMQTWLAEEEHRDG